MSYSSSTVLHAVDTHTFGVLLLFGLAWILQFVWWFAALRAARRDRCYPMPVSCLYLWFANDLNFDVRYDTWFHHYDHWFLQWFWVGMIVTAVCELLFLAQVWRLGRRELFGDLPGALSAALLALGAAYMVLIFALVRSVLDDPLFVLTPGITLVAYGPAGTGLLLHRRSRRGQSAAMWWSYVAMVLLYFSTTALYYSGPFRSALWLGVGATSVAWGLVTIVLLRRMPTADVRVAEEPRPPRARRPVPA
jgi:hypothetical protein